MTGVLDYLSRMLGGLAFWVVVLPWQQALRIRAGRHVRLLSAGLYLKIPGLDVIFVESVRRRSTLMQVQTLSTADGATVILGAVVLYAIRDVRALYNGLHHAEDTIAQLAQSLVAEEVFGTRRGEIEPGQLSERLNRRLAVTLAEYGLDEVALTITDFAFVRTFRLIQDSRWSHGQALDTSGARKDLR